jgi:hypothetical protein
MLECSVELRNTGNVGLLNAHLAPSMYSGLYIPNCRAAVLELGSGLLCNVSLEARYPDFNAGLMKFEVNAQAVNRADNVSAVYGVMQHSQALVQSPSMSVVITVASEQTGVFTKPGGCVRLALGVLSPPNTHHCSLVSQTLQGIHQGH